jgi:hypothetical protein
VPKLDLLQTPGDDCLRDRQFVEPGHRVLMIEVGPQHRTCALARINPTRDFDASLADHEPPESTAGAA